MSVVATVLYPNEPDATFDMKYYLETHMPLVQKNWAPMGLKSWTIVQHTEGLNGAAPEFTVQAHLVFDSLDSVKTAVTSESAKTVFGDVPNFSNKGPKFMVGNTMGSST